MIGIYKIINPNGKIYIGQTIDWDERQKMYKFLNCKNQRKLFNSIKKYSWDKHFKELIEECNVENLNIRERYWQEYYDVLNKGLNCKLTQTNDKSGFTSDETKKLISLGMLEKNTWSKGGYHKKSVLQYDLNGNFIKRYEYAELAKNEFNKDITFCCRNKQKICAGFLWFYEDNFNNDLLTEKLKKSSVNGNKNKKKSHSHALKLKNIISEVNKTKRKSILQYDMNNNFIKEWESILSAAQTLNLKSCNISNNIAGRTKFCGNFIWKYK